MPALRVGHLARVGLGRGDQLLQRLPRRVGAHRDAEGLARGAGDVGEVLQRIELHRAELREARHRDRDLADGVAVGLGARPSPSGPSMPEAPALLSTTIGLPELLRRGGAQRAHRHVGGAAGRPGADEGDRAARGSRRRRRARQRAASGGGAEAAEDELATIGMHGVSWLCRLPGSGSAFASRHSGPPRHCTQMKSGLDEAARRRARP